MYRVQTLLWVFLWDVIGSWLKAESFFRFRCQAEKRKTINGEDILFAMSTLGFDNYVEPLKLYLQKYREGMKGENKVRTTGKFFNLSARHG